MKTIKKSVAPAGLTRFKQESPKGTWEQFRNDALGESYKELRLQVATDQGGLCAYCEHSHQAHPELFSIEHFHPKSDKSDSELNWALEWNNMLGVCRGGREGDKSVYPTPENLSCDAHKDHIKQLVAIFNPLLMPTIKIFDFNKRTGALEVNVELPEDLAELAKNTIMVLNLNCYRLCTARLKVLHNFSKQIEKARKENNHLIKQQLAVYWFSKPWLSFFTTRRCLLGSSAESYLSEVSFAG